MQTRHYAVLEAPSTLGLASEGVELLPDRLVELGLATHIDARRAGRLQVPRKHSTPDPKTLPREMKAIDLPRVRESGIGIAAREAIEHLSRPELEGFFIHVDADCIDDAIMPAVDFRLPGGMLLEELQVVLRAALASGRAVGLEVAIYNPRLDADGSAGRRLVNLLKEVLRNP